MEDCKIIGISQLKEQRFYAEVLRTFYKFKKYLLHEQGTKLVTSMPVFRCSARRQIRPLRILKLISRAPITKLNPIRVPSILQFRFIQNYAFSQHTFSSFSSFFISDSGSTATTTVRSNTAAISSSVRPRVSG